MFVLQRIVIMVTACPTASYQPAAHRAGNLLTTLLWLWLRLLHCRQAAEAARAAIIADERRKLLLQAADLAEFLPPGAVKDRQELELMRQQAAAAAKQQQSGRF
jgi:hypothetical protein